MAHDLKIGALVAVTFLTAIGAAAAYRQSVQPAWQLVELLPMAAMETGDSFIPPAPKLPGSVGAAVPSQPPAPIVPVVEATPKKSVEKTPDSPATDKAKSTTSTPPTAKRPATNPFDIETPVTTVFQPDRKPSNQSAGAPLAPPKPIFGTEKADTKAPSPPPNLTANEPKSLPSKIVDGPLALPPPAEVVRTPASGKKPTELPKSVAEFSRASTPVPLQKPPESSPPKEIATSSTERVEPAKAIAKTSVSPDVPEPEEPTSDQRVVARSKPAPRDVEKKMMRPESETPIVIASGGGRLTAIPKADAAAKATTLATVPVGAPIAVATGVRQLDRRPKETALVEPTARTGRNDTKVQPATFDVVGTENRGEVFVPVKRAAEALSAVPKTNGSDSSNDGIRKASWDAPGIPIRANAAPINTSSVTIRQYDAQLYIVLDGDTYDRIAESMFRRKDLGPELARYNRSRLASNEPLPTASRILLPPMEVLVRDRPKSEIASAYSPQRESGRPYGAVDAREGVVAPVIPSVPGKAMSGSGTSDLGPPPADGIGKIPIAKPAGGGNAPVFPAANGIAPAIPNSTKANIRGIDPPPPTLRSGPGMTTREPPPIGANKEIRTAGATAPNGPTYTVRQPEETLYGIARRLLGDGKRFREIYELNTDKLPNEYDLPVGVTLRLPADAMRP